MLALSRNFLLGLRSKYVVTRALVVRDLMMRYGRGNIGFVWVVLEPMILTCGVMLMWSVMGAAKGGYAIVEVVLTGYMPLTLWRHLTGQTVNFFRASAPLLYHRKISLLDILSARFILEIIGTTTALVAIWTILYAVGAISLPQHLDLLLLGWSMMALIGCIAGIGFAVLTERAEISERFVQPIQYLNIPLSGAFFMVEWLPPWAQKLVMFHPHVHSYEVFRSGYFGDSIIAHYDLLYFFGFCLVLAFIIFLWFKDIRSKLQLT